MSAGINTNTLLFCYLQNAFHITRNETSTFFGWIKDLSDKDPTSIFNLFGLIPWDPPSFLIIGIWPILMGLSMWVQQKLNPAPADPIQAKIFAFFPVFLTIILASFPSGLVVYWTVNNILTIAQQWVIMRKTKVKTN